MAHRSVHKKTSTGALINRLANKMESLEQAAEALKESELKYRTLVEATDTGFVILDKRAASWTPIPDMSA